MCIVLFSTAHPDYALIAVDNRDEYVLRPTSRPHWWTHHPSGHRVLAARDLHRRERGTWLGLTRGGRFAVLTNYRESSVDDPDPSKTGVRSRGEIVNAWLGYPKDESLDDFVANIVDDESFKGVGGFSLVCGDLKARRKPATTQNGDGKAEQEEDGIQALAIVSNRSESAATVPRICAGRGRTWGLSNAIYSDDPTWPKIRDGEQLLEAAVRQAIEKPPQKKDGSGSGSGSDDALADYLMTEVLDDDKLTKYMRPDMPIVEFLDALRKSVLVPPYATKEAQLEMDKAREKGKGKPPFLEAEYDDSDDNGNTNDYNDKNGIGKEQGSNGTATSTTTAKQEANGEKTKNGDQKEGSFTRGAYGTQRQTVLLVDWEGNVTYKERALFDAWGNAVPKGEGDVVFRFSIDEDSP